MNATMGTKLLEALLGYRLPVTLSKMAWRGNISNEMMNASKIMSSTAAVNPLFCNVLSVEGDFVRSRVEDHNPLLMHVPIAMSTRMIHTSSGVLVRFMANVPKNQRMPLSLNRVLMDDDGMAADHSHDPRIMTM